MNHHHHNDKHNNNQYDNQYDKRGSRSSEQGGKRRPELPVALGTELRELALVAGGAIPGALLRWQLEVASLDIDGTPQVGDVAANMLGCLLLGMVVGLAMGQPSISTRLMLWAGIGLCGSLTTFSGWMLELVQALDRGAAATSLQVLLTSLISGLLLLGLGQLIGRRLAQFRGTGRPAVRPPVPGQPTRP